MFVGGPISWWADLAGYANAPRLPARSGGVRGLHHGALEQRPSQGSIASAAPKHNSNLVRRSMVFRNARLSAAVATLIVGLAVSSCSGSGLSASSSCKSFMSASPADQHEVIDQLASRYEKPDFATPLGEPEVAYYCAGDPSITLGQFFEKAED
jgi:hypothetical protein